jgi:hypothetical protein
MTSRPRKGPARTLQLRKLESRQCRRCGAEAGRQCVTASGSGAPWPHAERLNDAGGPNRFGEGTRLTSSIGMPRGPRGEYRGHTVKLQLTDQEYAVLAAESVRQQKPMALLMREAFFASVGEAAPEDDHLRHEPRSWGGSSLEHDTRG